MICEYRISCPEYKGTSIRCNSFRMFCSTRDMYLEDNENKRAELIKNREIARAKRKGMDLFLEDVEAIK
jgi:hypothetical protein